LYVFISRIRTKAHSTQIRKRSIMSEKRIAVLVVALVGFALTLSAGTPTRVNYQGLLLDSAGDPVPDASYSILFTIYDASAGGNSKWSETQVISTENGQFSVSLGSVNPILDTVFNQDDRYLAVKVGADPEMSSRTRLLTVPWAFRTSTVDGASGGAVTGNIQLSGNITVSAAVVNLALAVGGDLDVVGDATVGSNLDVGGAASIVSSAAIGGSMTVAGTIDCASLSTVTTVAVGTHAGVAGDLDVGGSAAIANNMLVGSDADVTGNLSCSGATSLGNTNVGGSLNVVNGASIGTNVTVGGTVSVTGDVDCNDLTTIGNANISADVAAGGSLAVGGAALVTSDITVGNSADIGGDLTTAGHSSVGGDCTVTGNLDVGGTGLINNDMTVSGKVTATNGLTTGDAASGDGMRFGKKFSTFASIDPIVACNSGYIWWDYANKELKLVETNAGNNYCHYIVGKNEGSGMTWGSNFINSGGTSILATLDANGECAIVEVSSESLTGGYIRLYCMYSNGKFIAHYTYRYQ
jgi:predicted acyltransferase (DUF342 family)